MTCEMETETVMQLLYVAKKYDVPALIKKCEVFLNDNMTEENVCTILNQAILFGADELKEQCLDLVAENGSKVLNSKGFLTLSREAVKAVLKLDPLEISGEEEVYTACKEWARETCRYASKDFEDVTQLRSELEDILPLIRFPTLSVETFVNVVSRDNILTESECMTIVRHIVNGENLSQFLGKDRSFTSKSFDVERFSNIESGWSQSGNQDGISFTSAKPVQLLAIALYLPWTSGQINGPLEVLEGQNIVLTQNVTLHYKTGTQYEFVTLQRRIPVKEGITYSIRLRLTGQHTFFGTTAKQQQTVEDKSIDFKNLAAGQSENSTDVSKGQIHGIKLYTKN